MFHSHRTSPVVSSRFRQQLAIKILFLMICIGLATAPAILATAQERGSERPGIYAELPSEIPADFTPVTDTFEFERREFNIPMRDGVRLHTVILVPKGAQRAPMLLTRTPYNANNQTSHANSSHLASVLRGYDNATDVIVEGGYIRVVQDIRGKHGSDGDYVVNRPLRGPLNATPVDHSTDTFDTIEWLVNNVPESNGKVGILGISYDGYLPLVALFDPHPALAVSVPMNPMVDGWMGDDWFHHGAFRQMMAPWIYQQVASRDGRFKLWNSHYDIYDMFLQAGSAAEYGRRVGLDKIGFWNKLVEHPNYDTFWREQALDRLLANQPLKVPVMVVHSWWDQEDIYGAPAVYQTLESKDAANDKVFFVAGPWSHGQMINNGSSLGAIKFHSDTARTFRREILRPFLDHYLKDSESPHGVKPVTVFQTGTNRWESFSAWPTRQDQDGVEAIGQRLHLRAGMKLSFDAPSKGESESETYVADPAKPVPFRNRPHLPLGYAEGNTWSEWLVDDQRNASTRTDVLVFTSDTLTAQLSLRGAPLVNLTAATTGSDSDWVVKLIDVYPDEVADDPRMGGYQLMIAADIFRARFREGFEAGKPLKANEPLRYRFALPQVNHVVLPGHRLMVQIQSSWFPLYDRNPQKFVPNIFHAKPADYQKATQTIFHAADKQSFIELPVVRLQQRK